MSVFGYVYDERMLEHRCEYDPTMAERPERMELIHERLLDDGLLDGAVKIEAREATDEELLTNHPVELLRELESLETSEQCEEYCKDKEILWLNPKSEKAARLAVGACIDVVKANIDGKIGNAFAMVRPPGHHSYGKLPQGYCVYNNVAIAAKIAVNKLGVKKVAIIDFDYHMGNGTFYSVREEEGIFFVSLHSYCYAAFWPFLPDFDYDTKGQQVFIPLNAAMNTEIDFYAAFEHVIMPVLESFGPEMTIVSAGFDAGYYDIMLEYGQAVKAHGYGHIVRLLDSLTPNKVISVLEGGYFPKNYVESAAMMVRGLQGLPLPKLDFSVPVGGAMCETIWNNIVHHSQKYDCMRMKLALLQEKQREKGLDEFVVAPKIYLGRKMRRLYDNVKKVRAVRTREWFPELSNELQELCNSKIQAYIENYDYEEIVPIVEKSLESHLDQLLWTEDQKADSYLSSARISLVFMDDYHMFIQGEKDHTMICDRELYDVILDRKKSK